LHKIDQIILWVLRVSLYQIEFMRVPNYAAVDEAVRLCRRFRKSSAQSFVNGLLRGFLREGPHLPGGSSSDDFAVRFSHPKWLVKRYLSRYGPELTEAILTRNNDKPESVLWVNPFKTNLVDFSKQLTANGIQHSLLEGLPNAVRIEAQGFSEHQLYQEGHCFFMDASSQKVARLCNLGSGWLIGDLCAAPGGKTFVMAEQVGPGSRILCSDVDDFRLGETRRRAEKYEIPVLGFVQMNLTQPAALVPNFDFLLLDVPCSGTGTFRSNPDARWRVKEADLGELHDRQISMLRHAFGLLLPGCDLIYSTCSTEPEENEDVVEEFLISEKRSELVGDYFRTFPDQELGDGFFAAQVRRV